MGRACLLAIVCGALLASTAVAASDYTDGEVAQKAQDVMEDRRQLLGTFPRLSSEQSLDAESDEPKPSPTCASARRLASSPTQIDSGVC